jgi:hypothetical protein
LHWFLLLFWLYLVLHLALVTPALVQGVSMLVQGASTFRVQLGSKPVSVFRIRSGSKPVCVAFTVVDFLMGTDSLMEMVE